MSDASRNDPDRIDADRTDAGSTDAGSTDAGSTDAGFDRADRALRTALRSLEPTGRVDPRRARRAVGRRRVLTAAGAAGIAAVTASVVWSGLGPGLTATPTLARPAAPNAGAETAGGANGGAPSGGAPNGGAKTTGAEDAGWRTEWYRDMRFDVPASWSYERTPGSDWCVDHDKERSAFDDSYVSIGRPGIVRDIRCEPPSAPLDVQGEHVAVLVPGPAEDYAAGTVKDGGWWTSVRFAGSAVVIAVSKDRALADRITASARAVGERGDAPCASTSRVSDPPVAEPPTATDLPSLTGISGATVCQYDPRTEADPGGLRAVRQLEGDEATALAALLAAPPLNESQCSPPPVDHTPDIGVVVRFVATDGIHDVYVDAVGCPDGHGTVGGIADGRTLRTLSAEACRALLVPPLRLERATGDLGPACLG